MAYFKLKPQQPSWSTQFLRGLAEQGAGMAGNLIQSAIMQALQNKFAKDRQKQQQDFMTNLEGSRARREALRANERENVRIDQQAIHEGWVQNMAAAQKAAADKTDAEKYARGLAAINRQEALDVMQGKLPDTLKTAGTTGEGGFLSPKSTPLPRMKPLGLDKEVKENIPPPPVQGKEDELFFDPSDTSEKQPPTSSVPALMGKMKESAPARMEGSNEMENRFRLEGSLGQRLEPRLNFPAEEKAGKGYISRGLGEIGKVPIDFTEQKPTAEEPNFLKKPLEVPTMKTPTVPTQQFEEGTRKTVSDLLGKGWEQKTQNISRQQEEAEKAAYKTRRGELLQSLSPEEKVKMSQAMTGTMEKPRTQGWTQEERIQLKQVDHALKVGRMNLQAEINEAHANGDHEMAIDLMNAGKAAGWDMSLPVRAGGLKPVGHQPIGEVPMTPKGRKTRQEGTPMNTPAGGTSERRVYSDEELRGLGKDQAYIDLYNSNPIVRKAKGLK